MAERQRSTKKKVAAKKPAIPEILPELNPDSDTETITEIPEDSDVFQDVNLSDRFTDFMSRNNTENLTSKLYVYKFKNPENQSGPRTFINKYEVNSYDEVPDEHDIGMMAGSGKYMCILQVPSGENTKKRQTGWIVNVHGRYDELRKQQGGSPSPGQAMAFSNGNRNQPIHVTVPPAGDPFDQIERIARLLKELNPAPPAQSSIQDMMTANVTMLNNVIQQSFMSNMKLLNSVVSKRFEEELEEEEEVIEIPPELQPALPGIVQALLPFAPVIGPFLNTLATKEGIDPGIQKMALFGVNFINQLLPKNQVPPPVSVQNG